ncbi:MAG: glycosyltransferase family 4 protein [Parcubacteria group bacterium]|nr:glycosyltransferase family 4 protein [Parcubacteria group bacterium]
MSLKDTNLTLFLTNKMSLEKWSDSGIFDREIDYYNKLAKHFKRVYIVSYGGTKELLYKKRLAKNIRVLFKNNNFPNIFYQLIAPFKFRKVFKKCAFFRTNQIDGAIPAIIAKLLFRKSNLIVRSGYIASLNAKLYKKNLVQKIYINFVEWLAYRLCNRAFITTKENASYLLNKYNFLKNKLTVLNNAINTGIFKPLNIEKKYDIGYVGRLQKDKNLLNLLKAVNKSNLKICTIGQGEEKNNLLNYARKNNINLTLVDRVENYKLPQYYNQFKIFVFPSLHEGNPKSLLEAMSCGVPIIGCNVIGVSNIISNGLNGIISATDDKSLRKKIGYLLRDNELKNKISLESINFIEKEYSFDFIIKKEIEIYENSL